VDWELRNRKQTIAMAFEPLGFGHAPLPPSPKAGGSVFTATLCWIRNKNPKTTGHTQHVAKTITLFSDRLHVTNRCIRGSHTPKAGFLCLHDDTASAETFVNDHAFERVFVGVSAHCV
jgi:hypothetical protein